jgi:hypothetical protein
MSPSDFSPARWISALLLLLVSFALLIFALLMDHRFTPDPYAPNQTPAVSNGNP